MEYNLKVKNRLQKYLDTTGATISSVAKAIDISVPSISYFLKDKRLLVPEVLHKIEDHIDDVKSKMVNL